MRPETTTCGKTLLTRSYRVVLECTVRIHAIAPAHPSFGCSEPYFRKLEPEKPPSAESLREQQLLQDALLAVPEALDGWLDSVVWMELDLLGFDSPKTNGEPFLLAAVEQLAPPLRQRFRDALRDRSFYDGVFQFLASFACRLRFVDIGAMSDPDCAVCRASTDRTRRYRIVLGYEIAVIDFTASEIEARYVDACRKWAEENPHRDPFRLRAIPSSQDVEDQRTLLHQLLDRPDVAEAWLRDMVMLDLEVSEAVDGVEAIHPRDQLLRPVIEGLPPRARHRFREAISRDRLLDVAREFRCAFHLRRQPLEILRL
jgi:hypothetical protein